MDILLNTDYEGFASGTTVEVNDKAVADSMISDNIGYEVDADGSVVTKGHAYWGNNSASQQMISAGVGAAGSSGGYASKGSWSNFGEFLKSVKDAGVPGTPRNVKLENWANRTAKTAGHMAEGEPTEGGYLVPAEFRTTLMQAALEHAIVRPRASFIPMATNRISVPAISDYDHRDSGSGLYGGIKIYRPSEAGEKTISKPHFDSITLSLHKNVALTYVSEELLEDSPISIEPLLNTLFGKAIAWHEDNDYINGTGAGMPLGILHAPCLITPTRSTCGAGYLNYVDIVTMWSRLHPASMGSSVWMVNNAMLPYLYQLCYTCTACDDSAITGTAAFMPGNGSSETPYSTLLGRPVIVTEHCPSLGNVGDIILADWSQYLIGGKAGQGVKMDSSMHVRFAFDEQAFRAVLRNDGQPWWNSPLVPKHTVSDLTTNNTLSPFVALTVHPAV